MAVENSQTIVDISLRDNVNKMESMDCRKGSYQQYHVNFRMPPSKSIDVTFENIYYSVNKSTFSREKNTILKGVSGIFKSGELTAIMGPSGAGKSTLLNVISGFIKGNVTGNIFANNSLEDANRSQIKTNSVYILQEDHLSPFFTVNEIMLHAANCKLGNSINYKSKIIYIDNILESMSMAETKNTRCNKLSGGQKKRLNVCLELLNNPPILFLDEPTTGLDSSSCALLVSELQGLAKTGRTVICTIHQPSAAMFALFDHLYLLSSGETVYQGDACSLMKFLECISLPCPKFHNPADFVMDVITGEFGNYREKLLECNKNHNWRNEVIHDSKQKPEEANKLAQVQAPPSEWLRYRYLVSKLFKQLKRDWASTNFKIVLHTFVGIVVGLLFSDTGKNGVKVFSNLAYMFSGLVYLSFTALMPAALKYPSEINIIKKEHFNNWYKFTTYFLAFLTISLPVQIMLTSIFVTLSYVLSGQIHEVWRFTLFIGVNIANSLVFECVGLIMGTFGPVNGVFNGSIFIVLMAVHGGFMAFIKLFPYFMYLSSFLCFTRYAFEVMIIAIYGLGRGKLDCPDNVLYCHLRYPELLFNEMGFNEDNFCRNWIVIAAYFFIIVLITYFRLRHKLKNFH